MNFTIQRNALFGALQKVQAVVEKKNTISILGNILCVVKDGKLSLCATDLDVGIKVTLPAEVKEEGKVTLSARHFFDIVKELPDKALSLSKKDNNWVEILCGKSKFNIVSLSADDYPPLPVFEEKNYFEAKVAALVDMIDRTQFAVSTDSTRYHLNGVFFENLDNNLMRMTGTDGHRLSFVDNEVFLKMPELKRGIIIPKKGLTELRKLLDEKPVTIGLSFEKAYLFAKTGDLYLFTRLIDGEYPDYRLVIPKATDKLLKMDREVFTSALKRVSLLANEKSRGVKLALQNGVLTISSSNPEMGEAREEIDVKYQGELLDVGFNSKYVLECLSVITSDEVEFRLNDRLSPGILRGSNEQNHTYVVMPMRV